MNQYIRNNEILKGFLKKPLTLVISILFFITAIIPNIYLVVKMISSGIFDSAALCVYSLLAVLPAAAFLNLFVNGRNSKSTKRLNTPLILIYIYTVLSVFLPVAFFTYWMFSYAIEKNEFAFVASAFIVFLIIPILILLVLQFVSMIVTFHSIRKSANGIYLSRKGSVFMGVTSFLISASVILITVNYIDATSYSRILNYSNIFDSVMPTLESAALLALFICLGIWSLTYSGAIQKAAVHLYGTNKRSAAKAQTLADTQAAHQAGFADNKTQNTIDFVPEKPFDTDINFIAEPTAYEKPDVFALPRQDESNPYESGNPVQKRNEQKETPDHINFQNPYENFVPQNPFSDY